ncbi:tail fiber domain-containing protein [bacterium]|nr:tail fiber domain-containing protein [bacterium]
MEIAATGAIQFNDAYTFPMVDGTNGQVLQTDGSGALSWASAGAGVSSIWDADTDTGIQVEEIGDEDIIRFDAGGTERMIIDSDGLVTIGGSGTTTGVGMSLEGDSNGVDIDTEFRITTGSTVPMPATASVFLDVGVNQGILRINKVEQEFFMDAVGTNSLIFKLDGTAVMRIDDSTGNVGINAVSPDADLDIEAAENTEFLRLTDSTNSDSVGFFTGNATPEGVVTAQLGSLFMDSAGGTLYLKDTGDGTNTGWVQVATGSTISNIYTVDGTLTGDRTLNTGGNSLTLQGTQYANIQLTFDDKVYFENYYSNVSMDDTNWNMHIEQGGGGTSTDFNIGNEITTITSSYGSFAGFQYGADYSANFVDRSLVDKGYVDNAIITGSNNIYTDNGTLSGDRVVDLGANFLTISDAGLSVNYGSRAAEILTQDWVGGTAQFIQNQASLLYSIRDGNGSDRTRTNFTSTSIEMGMSDDDFVTETNLIATAETIEIVSNRANFIGAIYDADYSANFTDRSLVDKAYVDGIVNNVPANNGLTNDSGTIQLGGALVENTQVTGDYTLRFDSTDTSSVSAAVNLNMGDARLSAAALGNTINHFRATQSSVEMLSDDNQGGSGTGISSITLDASTFGTVRTDSDLGLRYSADYSANFTDRSLVDKEYVDGLSGVSTFLALTDTPAAYTAGSLLFTSGSEVTEDNGNLFWDDTTNRLGIGTSTPSSILHVQQNHNGASDFYFTNTDSGVNAMTRLLMQNDVGEGGFGLVSSNFGAPYTNRVLMLAESNLAGILLAAQDVTGNIVFHTGGMSERMRIDANGNVGMGTSSPDADLDIEAAENTEMLRLTDSTNSDSVGFFTGNATPEGVVTAQLGSLFMDSASGELYIKDTGDGTNSGWEQVSTGAGGAFSTILSTTSNSPGTLATDDFVFGSNQLADDGNSDHDYRMFFDKSEGSFRAGMVDGTQWDNVNVGNISTALGWNVIASGNYSTALGHLATASGTSSTAIGYSATASGDYSTALGMGTLASHQYSTALGRGTIASGDHAMVMGYGTTASGLSSTAMGIDSTASGNYSTALGYDTVASGMISTSIGQDSHAAGSYSFTGGRNMRATSGSATFIWGYSGSSQSFAPADNRFLIFPQGDSGMVGIGTTTPSTTLHVDSNAANTVAMLTLENSAGDFQVFRTDVTPEGAVTGSVGDLVVDSNNGNMYIKNSGSGTNTGWVQLATGSGGGGTLDQAYDSGGAGAGRQIVADTGAVEITVSDASNNVGLVVNQNDVTNNPNGVQINHSGTGYGLYITEDEVNTDNVIARFSNTQAAVASGNYLLVDTDGHGIVIGGTNALAGSRGTMASVDFNTSTYSQLVQQGSDYVFQTGGAFGALQNSLTIANDGNAVFATDADSTTNAYQFTNLGSGNSLVVNDESGDTTPFVVNADGRVGIGTPTPSTTLHVDSNGANTVALLTLENTAGDFQVFRGDATPEGAVTGSIGDLAIDGTGGDIYIKNTGSGNNTGWVQLATGSGGGGDYSDGGEAGGADRTLGNTDAYALSLITNNTERLKIESGGDIDISQTIKIDGEQTVYNAQAEDGFTGSLIYGDGGTNLSHSSGSEGYYNTFVGIGSGNATTTGYSNTATGYTSFYTNTTGYHNMANGSEALRYNSTGYANVASGYQSLLANTTGYYNVASGSQALRSNTIGVENTAVGSQALYTNVAAGRSTAIGYRAMYNANNRATAAETRNTAVGYTALRGSTTAANNTGTRNTAIGDSALYGNTAGYRNTALGEVALVSNTTGNNNTASGVQSLQLNTSGGYNVGIGYLALDANTTGSNNTALGYNADVSSSGLTNATAIGNGATVDASNKVRIGDSSVTVIEGQVAWSYPSDSRLKENVEESVLGLEFIMDLNPVTFNYTAQGQEGIEYTGLIAQEVEEALNGTEFSGLNKPQNEDDFYSLSYSTFVVPLINAVQEQQIEIEALGVLSDNEEFVALVERVDSHDSDIDILKSENDAMQEALCGLGVEIFCE